VSTRSEERSQPSTCPAGQADAVALLTSAGYQQARWFHTMSRDLTTDLPEGTVPEAVRIVGYATGHSETARQIRNEAFRDHWGSTETAAEGCQHFVSHQVFRPEFSFLADLDDDPVGVPIGQEYDAFTEATGRREVYIAVVAVTGAARPRDRLRADPALARRQDRRLHLRRPARRRRLSHGRCEAL
jgi:mycothiol synthase